jgi:hypothetical protein
MSLEELESAPLLTRHAVAREPGQEIPGRYCDARKMWVVDLTTGALPLIEACGSLAALTTKTRVELESDDSTDEMIALQLLTKTEVQQERDDETLSAQGLLALTTKTDTTTEQDRQDYDASNISLVEIVTKTMVQQEQDRQDVGGFGLELVELTCDATAWEKQEERLPAYCATSVPIGFRPAH